MLPILYDDSYLSLQGTNGIGVLTDTVKCTVTEELGGAYELQLQYPVTGEFFSDIKLRSVIRAKANREDEAQYFRVYRITKPISGIITVYAYHLFYDMASIPVPPLGPVNGPDDASWELQARAGEINEDMPFIIDSRLPANDTVFEITSPISLKSALFGKEGSFTDVFGGELHFDRTAAVILPKRGEDRGVTIAYGKNLTDLSQDENIFETYTGIYPYAVIDEGYVVQLPERIVYADGDFGYTKVMPVDLTSMFTSEDGIKAEITEENLREAAAEYISENSFGIPEVSIKVSFVSLAETEEYKNIAHFEEVALGDTVSVIFEKLGVSATARCVKTVYNTLTEKYDSLEIGKASKKITDIIYDIARKVK